MRRKLNVRFLIIVLAVLIVPGVGVHFLHAFQVKRQSDSLLEQAKRAEESKNFDQAADYLSRYLIHKPEDTDVLTRYAELLERTAQSPQSRVKALIVLEQVLRRQPEKDDLRLRVVRLTQGMGRFKDSLEHLTPLLKARPDDGELLLLQGVCQEATGNYPAAAESYSKAVKYAPTQVESYVLLAALLRQRMRNDKRADQIMKDVVETNKESWSAWVARARYRQACRSLDDAMQAADKALTLGPDQAPVLLTASSIYLEKGNVAEARKLLQRGVEKHPGNTLLHQALSQLELRETGREEAVEALRAGLKNTPKDPEMLMQVADILIAENRLDEAREAIGSLRDAKVQPMFLELLEARILVNEGKWLRATQLLEKIRAPLNRFPNFARQADMTLGLCYQNLGDLDRQVVVYRRAIAASPGYPAPRYQLATALMTAGQLDEALSECQHLTNLNGAPSISWTLASRILLLRNLRLPAAQRKWEETMKVLDHADKLDPDSLDLALLRAEALLARDEPDKARDLLEQTRDKHPERFGTWVALVSLAERTKGPEHALALIDQAQKQVGDTADVRMLRIRYWAKRRGPEAAKHLEELSRGLGRFGSEDQIRMQATLAEAYLANGNAEQAEQLWTEVAKQQPDNLRVRRVLFDLAMQSGKEEQAGALARQIRELEGEEGIFWRYAEASRLLARVRKGDKSLIPDVRTRLTDLARRRSNWSVVPLLEGTLSELDGDPAKALDYYLKAIDMGEQQPRLVGRVVQLLNERNRFGEADKLLRKLEEKTELLGEMRRMAAESALQSKDFERALRLARQTVTPKSKDFRQLLWLAQFLMPLNRHAEAEELLKQAVELGGQTPDTWLALVQFFGRTGQKDRADLALQDAQNKVAPDQVSLTLAVGYELLGQAVLAEQHYRAAVAAKPDDAATLRNAAQFFLRREQFVNAEPHLRKLLSPKPAAPTETMVWARRQLAAGLTATGDYSRFQEALALLDQNLKVARSVEDLRARARVLATRPKHRDEALAIFEQTREQSPLQPEEILVLSQIYRAKRDWAKERQQLQNLALLQGDRPAVAALYIDALLRHGEKAEAQNWVGRLEKLQPRAFATKALTARLRHAQGNDGEAVRVLRDHAVSQGESQYVAIASVLEQIEQIPEAEKLYRASAASPKYPDTVLNLIAFLVRHEKVPEALDLLDKAWEKYRPELVAGVSLGLLSQGRLSEQQWQRVQQRVEAALKKIPQSASLLCCLALIRDFHQGQAAEAIPIYRRVLQIDPANIMALNNLAMLLSLHEKKHSEGLDLVGKALEVAGPEAVLLDTRGLIQIGAGRSDMAIKDLEEALAVGPTPYRYFHMAQARFAIKDKKGAAEAMEKSRSLGMKQEAIHPLERVAFNKLRFDILGR